MKNVALIIIYNHRYDQNIEKIERIYKDRFSHIFHLVPFYDGTKQNVIAVYENSYRFQGYIAQGLTAFFSDKFDHYFFIGDDLILNPELNEQNYAEVFRLDSDTAFIPSLVDLHKCDKFWHRVGEAYRYRVRSGGVEVENELPDAEQAHKSFARHNRITGSFPLFQIYRKPNKPANFRERYHYLIWIYRKIRYKRKKFMPSYPLIGGYADIFIVPSGVIKKFAHYSGAFAATGLFVELAIPTALVLTANKIVTEESLGRKGFAMWSTEDLQALEPYKNSLSNLFNNFPKELLYFHPVKLSKWKIDI